MKEIDWEKVKITVEVMECVIPKYGKTNWLLNDSDSQIILDDIYNTFYKDEAELAKDDKGKEKVNDKGKGKMDDKGKEKMDDMVDALEKGKSTLMVSEKGSKKASVDLVDALEKGKSKLMVSEKGSKKASVDLVDALDLQNIIKKLSEDFNMLVKAQKTKEAKEAKVVEVSSDEEDFSDEGFFGDKDVVLFNDVKYPLTDAEIRMFKERPTTSRAPIASTSTTSRSIVLIASTSNAQAASTAPRGYRKIAMT
ncbi:hypothetical protein Tco_1554301 [Tanacetum coccineum]